MRPVRKRTASAMNSTRLSKIGNSSYVIAMASIGHAPCTRSILPPIRHQISTLPFAFQLEPHFTSGQRPRCRLFGTPLQSQSRLAPIWVAWTYNGQTGEVLAGRWELAQFSELTLRSCAGTESYHPPRLRVRKNSRSSPATNSFPNSKVAALSGAGATRVFCLNCGSVGRRSPNQVATLREWRYREPRRAYGTP